MFQSLHLLLLLSALSGSYAHGHGDSHSHADGEHDPANAWQERYGPTIDLSFSGINTFAHLPHHKCLDEPGKPFDIAVLGAPFDTSVSYRPGARFGPFGIRSGSRRQAPSRGYSMQWGFNPWQQGEVIVDCGDIPVSPYDNSLAFEQIEIAYSTLLSRKVATEWAEEHGGMKAIALDKKEHPRIVSLGGDHSILLPILRSLSKVYGPVSVIHFDAHVDTWNGAEYVGAITKQSQITHGTFFWKAAQEGLITNTSSIHAGIRTRFSGLNDLVHDASVGFKLLTTDDIDDMGSSGIVKSIKDRVGNTPCYLSFDIDTIDPSMAPATGTPEPGGWTTREVKRILRGLGGLNIVGMDVVEVSPAYDSNAELTGMVAADLVQEFISMLVTEEAEAKPLLKAGEWTKTGEKKQYNNRKSGPINKPKNPLDAGFRPNSHSSSESSSANVYFKPFFASLVIIRRVMDPSQGPLPSMASTSTSEGTTIPKKRTRDGCLTCRKRKKRCDKEKPICQLCKRLELPCEWGDKPINRKKANGGGNAGIMIDVPVVRATPTRVSPEPGSETALDAWEFPSTLASTSSQIPAWNTTSDLSLLDSTSANSSGQPFDQQLSPSSPDSPSANTWASYLESLATFPTTSAVLEHQYVAQSNDSSDPLSLVRVGHHTNGFEPPELDFEGYLSLFSDFDLPAMADPMVDHSLGQGTLNVVQSQPFRPTISLDQPLTISLNPPNPPLTALSQCARIASSDWNFTQSYLLNHYTTNLAPLVSISPSKTSSPPTSPPPSSNLFLSLIPYAEQLPPLMHSILSWSAANLCAQGPGNEAMGTLADELATWAASELEVLIEGVNPEDGGNVKWEPILAAILMLVQSSICRGDIAHWRVRMLQAARFIQKTGGASRLAKSVLSKQLYRNLIYHDVLSSSSTKEGLLLNYHKLGSHRTKRTQRVAREGNIGTEDHEGADPIDEEDLDILMGLAEPVFLLVGRVRTLEHRKKETIKSKGGLLEEEDLIQLMDNSALIEAAIKEEGAQLSTFLSTHPDLEPHRHFHEVYSLAARLYLKMIQHLAPISLPIVMLVRRMLVLIDVISREDLPGHSSMHWCYHLLHLNSTPLTDASHTQTTDRERAKELFDFYQKKFPFLNVTRSRALVDEVWSRNDGGQKFVDPNDILDEWGWELNFA